MSPSNMCGFLPQAPSDCGRGSHDFLLPFVGSLVCSMHLCHHNLTWAASLFAKLVFSVGKAAHHRAKPCFDPVQLSTRRQASVRRLCALAQVRYAFLAGLAVVVLLIPVNRWLAVKIERASVRMMAHKDARLQVVGELLRGIHQVKLSAWEPRFIRKVNAPVNAPMLCSCTSQVVCQIIARHKRCCNSTAHLIMSSLGHIQA